MDGIIVLIISILLMLVGLGGVVVPFVPGIPLIWLGLAIYAFSTGFEAISLLTILILLVVTVALTVLDLLMPVWGAKKKQASKWGVLGAFLGTIVGIFILGIWGIILGPFLGALAGEMLSGKGKDQALKSAWGTFLGFLLGTLTRLVFALVMLGFLIASF